MEVKILEIRPEAKDMVTIVLGREDGFPLEYRAGQFLTFLFTMRGRDVRRSYSFASAPGVDAWPAIAVKRVVNGEVSRWIIDELRVGDVLRAIPPAGKFVLEPSERGVVFIAAGSGMVPVFSLMKEAMGRRKVMLISQNRDEESIPFRGALEKMNMEWVSLLSGRGERLSNGLLKELLRGMDLAGRLFYVCGPPAFMRMVVFTLRPLGVGADQIKQEHFTVEYVPPAPLLVDKGVKRVVVRAGGQVYRFDTAWPSTILQAALEQHIAMPYSCRGGRCSTCVARCISGSVKMSVNEVLTDKDLAEGLVLTCVGYAETDVELEL